MLVILDPAVGLLQRPVMVERSEFAHKVNRANDAAAARLMNDAVSESDGDFVVAGHDTLPSNSTVYAYSIVIFGEGSRDNPERCFRGMKFRVI